jgi:hypothetical protein
MSYKIFSLFGLIYVVSFIPALIMEIIHAYNPLQGFDLWLYIVTYLISLFSGSVMVFGFLKLGRRLENKFLVFASLLQILSLVFSTVYAVITALNPELYNIYHLLPISVVSGAIMISFGMALFKLKDKFGSIAPTIGTLDIVSGTLLSTLILVFIAIPLQLVSITLASILLYGADRKLEN